MNVLKQGIAVLCILIFLTGCAVTSDSNAESKEQEKSEREELILWASYETDGQRNAMDELVEAFNRAQEDYQLSWESHGPLSEFKKYLAEGMIRNRLPDLIIMDCVSLQGYLQRGVFLDLNEEMKVIQNPEEYYQASLENVKFNGKYYALPFSCYSKAVIYNQTYFEECGVDIPYNFNEFTGLARLLSTDEHYGFAVPLLTGEETALQFLPWVLSLNNEEEKLEEEGIQRAFQIIEQMTGYGGISRECINWSETDVTRKFINGECAMMLGSPSVLSELDKKQMDYGVFAFPSVAKPVSLVMGDALAIVKSGNIKGAQAFLEFFSEDEVMGNERQLQFGLPAKSRLTEDMVSKNEDYAPFASGLKDGKSIGAVENWVDFSDAVSTGMIGILTGQMTPEEATALLNGYDRE